MTLAGSLLLASLYAGGDAYSTSWALSHGAKESMLSMPIPARFALEVGVFTGADLFAQRSKWKGLPWVVRGVEVVGCGFVVVHNLKQGRRH
jgi:hypothetical protein